MSLPTRGFNIVVQYVFWFVNLMTQSSVITTIKQRQTPSAVSTGPSYVYTIVRHAKCESP